MELKVRILMQILVASLASNLGFIYRDYSNGKHKHAEHYLSCENECKNSCLGFAERAVFEAKSSASEPEFADAVVRLHKLVGNAVTQDRFIVVGTGSTQLIQAALYATSQPNSSEPVSVVSAAPYYSAYPFFANYLKSGLYEWGGDAHKFKGNGPSIEITVCNFIS